MSRYKPYLHIPRGLQFAGVNKPLPDPSTIAYGLGWVEDGVLYVNVNGTWVIASDLGLISGDEWDSVVVDENEIVTDGGVAVIDT